MTEAEIMKALECCLKNDILNDYCEVCPNLAMGSRCMNILMQSCIDLINRKNAEIEKLCGEIDELIIAKDQLFDEAEALIKKAIAESIKEFAERVKKAKKYSVERHENIVPIAVIDWIAKEMGGNYERKRT